MNMTNKEEELHIKKNDESQQERRKNEVNAEHTAQTLRCLLK